jgi:hypothetical protein
MRKDDFGPVRDVHQRLDRVLIEIHGDRLQAAGKEIGKRPVKRPDRRSATGQRAKNKKATACRGFHDSNRV